MAFHEIDLPTVLALGRKPGLPMPDEVKIVAVQAEDALTLGESLTPKVQRGMKETWRLVGSSRKREWNEARHAGEFGVPQLPLFHSPRQHTP